jgi:glycosyltransferase involved in cell wall biosynthesis
MKISIAMATYNGEQYLSEQLESFLKQDRLPDEVIVSDDCSTDRTELIIKRFAKRAPFDVIYTQNKINLGYCGNFNAAIERTTGDLVFLSDQDDVWLPSKISRVLQVSESNPNALLIMNDAELVDASLCKVGLTKLGQIESAGLGGNEFVMGCCCAFRRALLDIALPIPSAYESHDEWLVRFAIGLNRRVIDRTVQQLYRRHDNNESGFIANRTTKITSLDTFFSRFRKAIFEDKKSMYEKELAKQEMFLNGVSRAVLLPTKDLAESVVRLESIAKDELVRLLYRKNIRNSKLIFRLYKVIRSIVLGRYKYYDRAGIEAIKDILGS